MRLSISTAARHRLPIRSVLLVAGRRFRDDRAAHQPFTIHRHIAFLAGVASSALEWRMRRSAKLRAPRDIRDVHVPLSFIHGENAWLIDHKHSIALYGGVRTRRAARDRHPGNYHADRMFSVAREQVEPVFFDFLERYTPAT